MNVKTISNFLLNQFYDYQCDIVTIDGIQYEERLGFQIKMLLEKLTTADWDDDHVKHAQAVRYEHTTERYVGYSKYWRKRDKVIVELKQNRSSRRAIVYFGHDDEVPTCLTSLQFLVRDNRLDVIANFRSWELKEFAVYDLCLLTTLSSFIHAVLGDVSYGVLTVNAASAHVVK